MPASESAGKRSSGERNALFVSGLPANATAAQLEKVFSSIGPLRRSFVVTDASKKCKGVGFVHFALLEDARKAVQGLQGATVGGRRIRIDFARKRDRSSQGADEDGGLGKKKTGSVTEPKLFSVRPTAGNFKGSVASRTVIVKSRSPETTLKLDAITQKLDTTPENSLASSDGTSIRLLFKSWPEAGAAAMKIHSEEFDACVDALSGGRKCRLIVRNLPFSLRVSELRNAFQKVARVREISLPSRKKTSQGGSHECSVFSYPTDSDDTPTCCSGFGFVEFFLAADANRAVGAANGTKIGGRVVAVDLAIGKSAFVKKDVPETEEDDENPDKAASPSEPANEKEDDEDDESESDGSSDSGDSDDEEDSENVNQSHEIQPSIPELTQEKKKVVTEAKKVEVVEEETAGRRNRRLAKIGYIRPGSAAAKGLTEADLEKRAKAEKEKTVKLSSNPNAFVSDTRICVRNLPKFVDEYFLKHICLSVAAKKKEKSSNEPVIQPRIVHTKIVRDPKRNDSPRGFGFVSFEKHEHALRALNVLNNNPTLLETLIRARPKALRLDSESISRYRREWGKRRLIVDFSVEDSRTVKLLERVKEQRRAAREEAVKKNGKAKSQDVGTKRKRKPRNQRTDDRPAKTDQPPNDDREVKRAIKDDRKDRSMKKRKPEINVSLDLDGGDGNEAGSRRRKKAKKRKGVEEVDKFENLLAKYKATLAE